MSVIYKINVDSTGLKHRNSCPGIQYPDFLKSLKIIQKLNLRIIQNTETIHSSRT